MPEFQDAVHACSPHIVTFEEHALRRAIELEHEGMVERVTAAGRDIAARLSEELGMDVRCSEVRVSARD